MHHQQIQRTSARAPAVNYCNKMFQVERGLSHAMIYTSKIIDLDEERAAGAIHRIRVFPAAQTQRLQAP
jgi:hypothetical protein